jgi:mRNA-degrading endonuclease YafQ of YafQ-DinJ toxin-antitoxin module
MFEQWNTSRRTKRNKKPLQEKYKDHEQVGREFKRIYRKHQKPKPKNTKLST